MTDDFKSRLFKLPVIDSFNCNLWLLDFSNIKNHEIMQAKKVLSLTELERCRKYQSHDLKAQFIVSRLLIKSILTDILNCTFGEIAIHYSDFGKPFLDKKLNCHFSYSDSYKLGLFALSEYDVGVDIEFIDTNPNIFETLAVIATPSEMEWVLEHNHFERFYLLWTLKEAYLKCLGIGLLGPLPEVYSIIRNPLGAISSFPGKRSMEMYSNRHDNYIYSLSIDRKRS